MRRAARRARFRSSAGTPETSTEPLTLRVKPSAGWAYTSSQSDTA